MRARQSQAVQQIQQQRAESFTVTLTWHASEYKIHQSAQELREGRGGRPGPPVPKISRFY